MTQALTKYWKTDMTEDFFWHKMDNISTNNAIMISGMPEEVIEKIFNMTGNIGTRVQQLPGGKRRVSKGFKFG